MPHKIEIEEVEEINPQFLLFPITLLGFLIMSYFALKEYRWISLLIIVIVLAFALIKSKLKKKQKNTKKRTT